MRAEWPPRIQRSDDFKADAVQGRNCSGRSVFRPFGAGASLTFGPTPCGVSCILTPLRGYRKRYHGSGFELEFDVASQLGTGARVHITAYSETEKDTWASAGGIRSCTALLCLSLF